ncbi:hypothetical protein PC110_g12760 [Phytophthora cactorum]|uniref:Uncharacterized protein n=1 Tax=Phytophthora cactorum TaxID=29920 RepID=A0A329S1R1_9STRA|nr:hypothetical protein PC110_g12760 [Phytophthora cactorum]
MSLGPSGASMLEIRAKSQRQEARKRVQQQDLAPEKQDPTPLSRNPARSSTSEARSTSDQTHRNLPQTPSSTPGQTATARSSDTSPGSLQRYFEAAMSCFLAEQGMATATREAGHPGTQDVEMESVGEVDLADLHEEFDPDDLNFPSPSPAAVVAMTGAGGGDPDLADRLTLLRLMDADELEEVLRALDCAKHHHKKAVTGSNKFRQRAPAPMAPARRAQKIQVPDSGTESGSDESDSDPDGHPRICLAAGEDRVSKGVDDQKRARAVAKGIDAWLI